MVSDALDIETYQQLTTMDKVKVGLLLMLGHSLGYSLCYYKVYNL